MKFPRKAVLTTVSVAALAVCTTATLTSAAANPHRVDGDRTAAVRNEVKAGPARNVIMFLGDGMGDSEITIARNYAKGAAGQLNMDTLPMTGSYTTYAVQKGTSIPDYVTDSAASGTGWATGTKTYNNAVGVDTNGVPLENLLEAAKKNGLKTGNVTTSEIQDATPAVLEAHVTARSCYGPVVTSTTCPTNAKENGGLGSITEQLLDTRADVTLGGGSTTFNETAKAGAYAGQTLLAQAGTRGFAVVNDKGGLDAIGDIAKPVLGLFAPGNMPTVWTGPQAKNGGIAGTCGPNPALSATAPTLPQMTQKALTLLDKASRPTSKGFYLQVEGASIDKQDHAANPCAQIGETIEFDNAIKLALDYARNRQDTLVIVTADHGHTSQIISNSAAATSPGATETLTTADNAQMTINYGTAPVTGSQEHTGTQVRLAAYGPYAANVTGLTDQTDLNSTIVGALRLIRNIPSTDATLAALDGAIATVKSLQAVTGTLHLSGAQKAQLLARLALLDRALPDARTAFATFAASPTSTSAKFKAKAELQTANRIADSLVDYLKGSGIAQPGLDELKAGASSIDAAVEGALHKVG
jgi:alkaline phosphatase